MTDSVVAPQARLVHTGWGLEPGLGSAFSVIRDPSGAEVQLWQPKGHFGAAIVNEVGTWTWNELVTPDPDATKTFYGDLFGWTAEVLPGALPRTSFTLGNLLIGGAPMLRRKPRPDRAVDRLVRRGRRRRRRGAPSSSASPSEAIDELIGMRRSDEIKLITSSP